MLETVIESFYAMLLPMHDVTVDDGARIWFMRYLMIIAQGQIWLVCLRSKCFQAISVHLWVIKNKYDFAASPICERVQRLRVLRQQDQDLDGVLYRYRQGPG